MSNDKIDWAKLAKRHPDDVVAFLDAVNREMRRVMPAEKDLDIIKDRLAGGATDPNANFYSDRLHKRLRKFSTPELIDIICHLANCDTDDFEEALERIDDAVDTVLSTRYSNRHPPV